MTAIELANDTTAAEYIVQDIAVANQGGICSGRFKTLKTSVALDLSLSVASGLEFLGRFQVPKQRRVWMLSGESGKSKLRKSAGIMASAKGFNLTDLGDDWQLSTRIPDLTNDAHLSGLRRNVERQRIDVLIIDPSYIAFAGIAPQQ